MVDQPVCRNASWQLHLYSPPLIPTGSTLSSSHAHLAKPPHLLLALSLQRTASGSVVTVQAADFSNVNIKFHCDSGATTTASYLSARRALLQLLPALRSLLQQSTTISATMHTNLAADNIPLAGSGTRTTLQNALSKGITAGMPARYGTTGVVAAVTDAFAADSCAACHLFYLPSASNSLQAVEICP